MCEADLLEKGACTTMTTPSQAHMLPGCLCAVVCNLGRWEQAVGSKGSSQYRPWVMLAMSVTSGSLSVSAFLKKSFFIASPQVIECGVYVCETIIPVCWHWQNRRTGESVCAGLRPHNPGYHL